MVTDLEIEARGVFWGPEKASDDSVGASWLTEVGWRQLCDGEHAMRMRDGLQLGRRCPAARASKRRVGRW